MPVEVETIRSNRDDASKPLSTTYLNDQMDALDLIEQLIRATRLVEGTIGALIAPDGFETSSTSFGGYTKVSGGQTVIIIDSTNAKNKRFTLKSIGSGATPDIFIDTDDVTLEGIETGDKYIIIYGLPTSLLGHGHSGVDSEFIPSITMTIQFVFGEMFS